MPIYEFTCKSCGKDSEVIVRSEEDHKCDFCGSTEVIRKISLFAVNKNEDPSCQGGCGGGFESGACGSGMCGGN